MQVKLMEVVQHGANNSHTLQVTLADGTTKVLLDNAKYNDAMEQAVAICNGKTAYILHREDGPAFVSPELTEYYQDGKLHREDGPAIIDHTDGAVFTCELGYAWFIRGQNVTDAHRHEVPGQDPCRLRTGVRQPR